MRQNMLRTYFAIISKIKAANKANQHGALKASHKKRATLLMPSYLRRYIFKPTTEGTQG